MLLRTVDINVLIPESNVQAKVTKTTRGLICCLQEFLSQCRTGHSSDHFRCDFAERGS